MIVEHGNTAVMDDPAELSSGMATDKPIPVNRIGLDDYADQQRQMRLQYRWREVQRAMGPRYANCTFENFTVADELQRSVWQSIKGYLRELPKHRKEGHGLLLFGPRGTGKTHLASAALSVAVRVFGMMPAWTDGQRLFAEMRDAIGSDSKEAESIAKYTAADVLLVDDPLPGNADRAVTDFQQGILWRIIDARYRNFRPTWITANVANEAELSARLGAQLADRIIDGSRCLRCHWASARKVLP